MSDRVRAFVLAGGQSTRMGRDKAFLSLGGHTLLERALALARRAAPQVTIVGPASKFAHFGDVIEDRFPGHGPLGGIHAALRASHSEQNLFLAVDTPFVDPRFLHSLLSHAARGAIVTLPATEDATLPNGRRLHPLCAVYRPAFANVAELALLQDRNKIELLLDQVTTEIIGPDQLATLGFPADMFRNLNSPKDAEEAGATFTPLPD